jgi:hypothetical protein
MRIRSLLSAALLGSASLVVVAAPAQATPHCSTSYFLCVFENRDFGGALLQTSQSNTNWDYLGNPAAFRRMNDEDSAAANSTTRTYARIYEHDGYTGGSYCVRPQQEIAYVGDGYNDEGSSHRFLSAC